MKYTPLSSSSPFPLGATCQRIGENITWNFAIYSTEKLSHLIIQDIERINPPHLVQLDDLTHKTGDIWHIRIETKEKVLLWAWAKRNTLQTDQLITIQDPFAKLLDTKNTWGDNRWRELREGSNILPLGIAIDWDEHYTHSHSLQEIKPSASKYPTAIYEMHIRGFTKDTTSKVSSPGTFKGAIDKLDHLEKMGIDTIELLPITEFDETEWPFSNPVSQEKLYNYWGYSPLNFFAPTGRYFTSQHPLHWPHELKEFVDKCHEKKIRVILDVVYNHTGEGNEKGPSYSFKSLAPESYYILNERHQYLNYSGCGNTINANHPVVIDMIRESLRHWVLAYGIDGFRFDLAACLTRSQTGAPMGEPPLLEEIAQDPVLRDKILIAEPWDAAGLYQTGALHHLNQKRVSLFYEWNDKFRDDVRHFMKGDKGFAGIFASRLSGSQDVYSSAPSPKVSVNYVTAHDGFSLADLVSYNAKHNIENGEHNNDGMNENHAWNSGVEGETKDSNCLALRRRRMENMLTALFLSQGTPMLLMGDEYGHTKHGNNNAWCQDSILNWFQWDKVHHSPCFTQFIKTLIHIRMIPGLFDKEGFLTPSDVEWHGKKPYSPDWSWDSQFVAFSLLDQSGKSALYAAFSTEAHDTLVELPPPPEGSCWHTVIHTGVLGPRDYFDLFEAPKMSSHRIKLHSHSCIVLLANHLLHSATE